jgi:hypothetical protein
MSALRYAKHSRCCSVKTYMILAILLLGRNVSAEAVETSAGHL